MKEAAFQRAVLDVARLLGWRVAHFRPAQTAKGWRTPVAADGAGFPDLVLAHPQRGVIFAELKSEHGRVSPAQAAWHDTLAAAGARTFVWRPGDLPTISRTLLGAAPLAADTPRLGTARLAAPNPVTPHKEPAHAA